MITECVGPLMRRDDGRSLAPAAAPGPGAAPATVTGIIIVAASSAGAAATGNASSSLFVSAPAARGPKVEDFWTTKTKAPSSELEH